MTYLINLFIKAKYGTLRRLILSYSTQTGLGTYTIRTHRGNRWSGIITQRRLEIFSQWIDSGKLVLMNYDYEGKTRKATFLPSHAWGWRDIFRFSQLLKPGGEHAVLANDEALRTLVNA